MWLGDSAADGDGAKLDALIAALSEVADGARTTTLVLDDPSGNTYVQALEVCSRLASSWRAAR